MGDGPVALIAAVALGLAVEPIYILGVVFGSGSLGHDRLASQRGHIMCPGSRQHAPAKAIAAVADSRLADRDRLSGGSKNNYSGRPISPASAPTGTRSGIGGRWK